MNWRPSQDDTEQSDASVKSIGALGEVKTGTPQSDHAKLGRVQTRTSPANGKSYSMNWRPESPEEPSSLELQPRFATLTTSQKSLPKKQETPAKSTVRKEFLCSLNNKYCPVVHCFGRDSYTAAVDGTSLALEKSKSRAEWKMRWLPAEVDLEERGIQSLARAIYACVYAAMSENRLDDITITTLEHPGTPWPRNISSFRRALDSMGLTLSTTLTISNLHVLQLLVLLYPALIRPPLPYSQQSSVISESSNGCKVSHPARRPLKVVKDGTVVYSRWISGWSCHLNVSRSCVDDVYRVNVAMDHQDGRDADEPYSFSIYWALEHLGNEKRRDRRTIGDYDRCECIDRCYGIASFRKCVMRPQTLSHTIRKRISSSISMICVFLW